ncbi:hypothetical protein B0H14DRAFT_3894473 [Mycena olivaceomarginata]|nr:hypothetical protein B0H14DRAFT_3894473 [Mycena olivaceomarginata]
MVSPPDSAGAAAIAQELIGLMPATMGATLIGLFLSTVFYGVTLLQTYQYYNKYIREDSRYLLILVGVLTALDSFAVIANMQSCYFYLISNFANPLAILRIDWSLTFSVISTACVAFLVQCFYAYRVWICERTQISRSLDYSYMSLMFHNGSLLYIPTITWISSGSLGCSLGADLVIASTMIMYLSRGLQQGFHSVCTIITLILGEILSSTFYNTIFYYPLSKCYVNSMLAFLNARESLRAQAGVSLNLASLPHSSSGMAATDSAIAGTAASPLGSVGMIFAKIPN